MTTVDLRIPGDLYAALSIDIRRRYEWAGYLLCGVLSDGGKQSLLAREWCPVPVHHQVKSTLHGFTWHSDFDVEMLNRLQRENLAGVVLHYHGGSSPRLSPTDDATAASLMPFLSREAPGRPHAFGVFGDRNVSGHVFRDGAPVGAMDTVTISASWLDDWQQEEPEHTNDSTDPRHDRLIRGFGSKAYARLRRSRIGVVGCGGAASHVIQQLAYLGVGAQVIADADRVDKTSLGRLIGALPGRLGQRFLHRLLSRKRSDVGRPKVEVMKRMADAINPSALVVAIDEYFPTPRTVREIRRCDVIVACVDRLQVRDDLNRLCKRYLIPMLDVGIEITPDRDHPGMIEAISGRVTKVLADGPCLRCQGIVDDEKLRAERDGQALGYTGAARVPDPAVVTLNGIVASTAATEVLQLLTGFAGSKSPNCGWTYDGLTGAMERAEKPFRPCEECSRERGAGDA